MKNFSSPSNHRHPPPPPPPPGGRKPYYYNQHGYRNNPYHYHHHQRPNYRAGNNPFYGCYRPPESTANLNILQRPNFTIQLLKDSSSSHPEPNNLDTLISELNPSPERYQINKDGKTVAALYFREWTHSLSAIVSLWRSRLDGSHHFLPKLSSNVIVPSDTVELEQNLRTLFCNHIKGLMEGDLVKKWQKKIDDKSDEIAGISKQMSTRHWSMGRFYELDDKKKALMAERSMISKRSKEFKGGLRSLLGCLEDAAEAGNEEEDEAVEVFQVDREFDPKRIYSLILRECRRLEDGLPIYAQRQEILTRIHGEQVQL